MPLATCESGVPAKSEQKSCTGPAATSASSTASAPEHERHAVQLAVRVDEREVVVVHAAVVDVDPHARRP